MTDPREERMRAEFEKRAEGEFYHLPDPFLRRDDGDYLYIEPRKRWQGYLEGRLAQREEDASLIGELVEYATHRKDSQDQPDCSVFEAGGKCDCGLADLMPKVNEFLLADSAIRGAEK